MDETDYKILRILQKKARIPNIEVSRQIGMAPSAVLERIKKLESRGIIEGYEVRLNPDHFEQSMIVFVHVFPANAADIPATCRKISGIPQVQEVHFLAGGDVVLVKLRAADTKELEKILTEKINPVENVLKTKTFIVLSTCKESAEIVITEQSKQGDK